MLIQERLRQTEKFTEVDRVIAEYFLTKGTACKEDSVRTIADRLYVAPSSIVRFCHRMGYQGITEFKRAYLEELDYLSAHFQTIDPNYPFEQTDSPMKVANKILSLYQETLEDCQSLLSAMQIEDAVRILRESKEIYICTSGAQLGLVETFQDKMQKIGRLVHICHQTDEAYYHACYCSEKSCFLLISYSGETTRVLRIVKKLNERVIPVVGITSFGENSLAQACNLCLFVSTREKLTQNLGSFGMNISVMYLLDMLYANYFNLEYEKHYRQKMINTKAFESGIERTRRHSDNPVLEDEESF